MTPRLFHPCAALTEHVAFFGYWDRRDGAVHRSRALPRGAATVIIDLSARQYVDFFAADGTTRLDVSPAFIAGAGEVSYVTQIDSTQAVMTIHFRPGSALFGIPLGELENRCAGLDDVWGRDGTVLHERLLDACSAPQRITLVQDFLLARLGSRRPAVAAVLAAAERNPALRVAEAGELTGLSPKRLITLFRSEVGQSPKAYLRVRRLQAALRRLDTGTERGADIAADLGYFDQAHFVRDFRSFTAMTPTQYVQRRLSLPSHVGLSPSH